MSPAMSVRFFCHWHRNGSAPRATTLNRALPPSAAPWLHGDSKSVGGWLASTVSVIASPNNSPAAFGNGHHGGQILARQACQVSGRHFVPGQHPPPDVHVVHHQVLNPDTASVRVTPCLVTSRRRNDDVSAKRP